MTEERIEVEQNKCTACGANMVFDIESGGLACRHCGSKTEFNDTEEVTRRRICEELLSTNPQWSEGSVFQCSNCGAKEVLDKKTLARKCAFCGSAKIVAIDELPGIRPDSVIPFQITESMAVERFKKWIKTRWFAPSSFKKSSDIRKQMNAIYSPCWSLSSQTTNQYRGVLGRTTTVQVRSGNGFRTQSRVSWFKVSGAIDQDYIDQMYKSGQRISSRNFNALKPFDINLIRIYRQEYLSGIIAEHYTLTLEQCFREFALMIKRDVRHRITRKHGADRIQSLDVQTEFNTRKFNYVLLPIYISNYTYKGKLYNFYINGATGKVVGKHPKSKLKIWGLILGVGTLVGAVVAAAVVRIMLYTI